MPTITQDLKLQSDPSTIVRPNIQSSNIPSSAVTSDKIASAAVTSSKIASSAVTSDKIADGAIITAKLDDSSVTTAKLANLSVGTAQLKDDSVNIDKLKIDIEDWTISAIQELQDLYNEVINLLTDIKVLRIYYSTGSSVTDFIVKANDNYANMTFIFNNSELTLSSDQDAIDFYNDYIVPGYIKVLRIGE